MLAEAAVPTETSSWITAWLAEVARITPDLVGTSVGLWEGGVRVHVVTPEQEVDLDLHPRVEGNAFATTPSLTLYVRLPEGQSLTQRTGEVLARLVGRLRAIDLGGLVLPKGEQIHVADAAKPERPPLTLDAILAWRDAESEYADRLHLYSFLALQTILTDDLYPHMSLGEPIDEAEIQASWRHTAALIGEGRAPQKLGIYVHVPYCTVECSFCYCGKTEDFTRTDVDGYVDRLVEELEAYAPLVRGRAITSVYFGGGTPSLLTPPALRRVFETMYGLFDVPEGTQVIFEGNPDSLKPAKIEILGGLGRVTRLTIGIQTLDPVVQKFVRRFNKKEDIEAAITAARAAGIPHVNFDCIAGLDGQTMASFQHDLDYLLSLEPDSIHLNGFRPLPRTLYAHGGHALSPEQEALRDAMMAWGEDRLAHQGHTNTMEQGPHRTRNAANLQEYDLRKQNSSLLGFGYPARSHSFGGFYYQRDTEDGFVPALRRQNAGTRRYKGLRADLREEMHKYLVTNIRGGFARSEFVDLFGMDPRDAAPEGFKVLERLGVIETVGDRILFHTGRHVDSLVLRLFFYSDDLIRRAMAAWGGSYRRDEDYKRHLEYLVPPAD